MAEKTYQRIVTILSIVSLLLGIIGSTFGWVRRSAIIESDMKHCAVEMEGTKDLAVKSITTAKQNEKDIAVIQAEIRAGFAEIMRRLDRLER